jgi:cell division GTPase FtsZ
MIGVIGLGGAGGNIADEAQKLGFLTGAINFSQKDLDAVDVRYKLRLSGSEGVGKNREEAIKLFNDQWETAIRFIQDNFSNEDVLVFTFSSSGGSGSAIAPVLLEILSSVMPDKVLSAFVILPDLSEAPVSQTNCLQTFEELSRLSISIFPIDNQQAKNKFAAKNKIFEYTNKRAIELLSTIASYTEKTSKNGNFDKRDFLTVLGTSGIASISEVEIATLQKGIALSKEWVSERVVESWTNNVFVSVENEKVTRAAVIFDGQEGLLEFVSHEHMFQFFSKGMPIDLFEGNYHENNGKLLTILTGLEWCHLRLNDIEKSLESKKDNLESVLSVQNHFQSKTVDFFSKLRKQPEKKQSVLDILSKYKR